MSNIYTRYTRFLLAWQGKVKRERGREKERGGELRHWVCIVSVPSALSRSAASKSSVYLCYARAKSPVETINLALWLLLRLLKHPPLPLQTTELPPRRRLQTSKLEILICSPGWQNEDRLLPDALTPSLEDTLRWLNYCWPVHSTRYFPLWRISRPRGQSPAISRRMEM